MDVYFCKLPAGGHFTANKHNSEEASIIQTKLCHSTVSSSSSERGP